MRTVIGEQDTLHWILSDHLGSVNVTANEDGSWNSEIRYTAFGEVRWKDGITPTEYRYTGQLEQAELGLYYYVSRFYDPELAHFIQADTIVPQPGNPVTYDRFAYVRNNPLNATDPTGHAACVDSDCNVVAHPQTNRLFSRGGSLTTAAQSVVKDLGGVNDLEAMAIITEVGASMYKTWDKLLPELSEVFNGAASIIPAGSLLAGAWADGCAGVGREPHDCGKNQYYFRDKGFHKDFQDAHNQPFHLWANIAQTASPRGDMNEAIYGVQIGIAANIFHEVIQSMLKKDGGWGTSWQDYVLSEAGWEVGALITDGTIRPSELADVIRTTFGPGGKGSQGKLQWINEHLPSLAGSPN